MRWWPLLMLTGCVSEKVTDGPESDADTDTDADSDVDTDADADATVLINFPPDCNDARAIGPDLGESNHLAAVALGPTVWPWRVDRVKIALSNEEQEEKSCDAGKAHTAYAWVLEPTEVRPPNDRDPDATFEFEAATVEDPVRLLTGTFTPPLVLEGGQTLAVAVQFAGIYPDTSCITACAQSYLADVDFWSNADTRPYNWSYLGDFGIASNLWIFAEGGPVE